MFALRRRLRALEREVQDLRSIINDLRYRDHLDDVHLSPAAGYISTTPELDRHIPGIRRRVIRIEKALNLKPFRWVEGHFDDFEEAGK